MRAIAVVDRVEGDDGVVDGVEAAAIDAMDRVLQAQLRPGRPPHLVHVVVDVPVGRHGRRDLLGAFEKRAPAESRRGLARPPLRADDPAADERLREFPRAVVGPVVDEVDVEALPDEMGERRHDDVGLVVSLDDREDAEAVGRRLETRGDGMVAHGDQRTAFRSPAAEGHPQSGGAEDRREAGRIPPRRAADRRHVQDGGGRALHHAAQAREQSAGLRFVFEDVEDVDQRSRQRPALRRRGGRRVEPDPALARMGGREAVEQRVVPRLRRRPDPSNPLHLIHDCLLSSHGELPAINAEIARNTG